MDGKINKKGASSLEIIVPVVLGIFLLALLIMLFYADLKDLALEAISGLKRAIFKAG